MQNYRPLPLLSLKIHHRDNRPMGQATNDEIKMNLLSRSSLSLSRLERDGYRPCQRLPWDYSGQNFLFPGRPPGLIAFPVFPENPPESFSSNCIKGPQSSWRF
ncbi:hypothetical protein NPIL_4301 [Nephila pilipes]|uniref:Uncharacterized protein n=1 Tax=Nephila pilipes TaxID=299642 RepID=A0A8X6IRT9_NEPPI|nr:hypothetical protein NPIL_4301 [Nephila pilipes]